MQNPKGVVGFHAVVDRSWLYIPARSTPTPRSTAKRKKNT
jgi:hypothetical protein